MEAATRIAIELDHPAYDCIYLALAIDNGCKFVTADPRLLRKLHQRWQPTLRACAISLTEAAKL
jgi:predicted nucleic acid-binding protein